MKSLVLDFENKINDKNYSITDLLRHCLIIARKLKQKEFVEWINNELKFCRRWRIISRNKNSKKRNQKFK